MQRHLLNKPLNGRSGLPRMMNCRSGSSRHNLVNFSLHWTKFNTLDESVNALNENPLNAASVGRTIVKFGYLLKSKLSRYPLKNAIMVLR